MIIVVRILWALHVADVRAEHFGVTPKNHVVCADVSFSSCLPYGGP